MDQDESDRGLDGVGAILKIWAQHPISLPTREGKEITRELEAWVSHLLLGHSRPGAPPDEAKRGKIAQRDWAGMRQFVSGLRIEEASFVRQALADFRSTVQGMVLRVRQAIGEERVLDTRLEEQLETLRVAASGSDLRTLRTAAEKAVEAVSAVLGAHRSRQAAQETEMSTRLAAMGERLQAAEQLAEEDPLTGLVNRRGFDTELAKAADLSGQYDVASSLLVIDLDHFKQVNDTHGHPAGDSVLREVANALTRSFPRRSDCVARYGGEEFAVVLRDSRNGESLRLANRFLEGLRTLRIKHEELELKIAASVGCAELRQGESAEEWLARADAALYSAKSTGRDRAVLG